MAGDSDKPKDTPGQPEVQAGDDPDEEVAKPAEETPKPAVEERIVERGAARCAHLLCVWADVVPQPRSSCKMVNRHDTDTTRAFSPRIQRKGGPGKTRTRQSL